MSTDEAVLTAADKSFLQQFEQLYDQIYTGQVSIQEYLANLDSLVIPQTIVVTQDFDSFKANIDYLLENKDQAGFQNAELYLMYGELESFYKFVEGIKREKAELELQLLVRFILEYLQDTHTSHLPEFYFTALAGSRNRAFVTAVVRRLDMPL